MKKNSLIWLPWAVLIGLLALYNIAFPLPASNDFPGMALHCMLVKQEGWKYLINNNTGFAQLGLLSFLTELFGNLLFAQRFAAGVFCIAGFWLIRKISFEALNLPADRVAFIGLLALASSYFFMELALMPHLDIIPICMVLFGIWRLLKGLSPGGAFAVGVVMGAAYWFRFHFIGYAFLFPALVWALSENRRWVKSLSAFGGVVAAWLAPHALTYAAFGVFSITNQKAVLYELINREHIDWSCDFQQRLLQLPYSEILKDFHLADSLRRFFAELSYLPEISMPLLILLTFFFLKIKKQPGKGWTIGNAADRKALLAGAYCAASILPFLYLRGDPPRLMAALVLPVFPFVLYAVRQHLRIYAAMILLLAFALCWRFATNFSYHRNNTARLAAIRHLAEATLPKALLKAEQTTVVATGEFYLPYRKYAVAYPALTCCWPCRYEPFFQHFDRLEIPIPESNPIKNHLEYVIFTHPQEPGTVSPVQDMGAWLRQAEKVAENEYASIYRIIR
jgi:hypothetical protein